MAEDLRRALGKRHGFESPDQEVVLQLLRTADRVQLRLERLFRTFGLTASQYNVLRILRGEGAPLPVLEIAARTITQVPGITGLIDRLERVGLVERRRDETDRRVVRVALAPRAGALLKKIDAPLRDLHRRLAADLTGAEMAELARLLEKMRDPDESFPTPSPPND